MLNASSVKFGQTPQGSLEEMLNVVRFGQDIGHTGPLIQSLVGINIANEAAQVYTSQIEKIYQKNVAKTIKLTGYWV
ncbi:hypothetical protein COW36_19380 [bacterium (Candidatus Blackallbacteria) CG17_big_fil_post_rev_8_21_14_2_50_48_46]|uniref:Uncharacterized protein n=1 Tax=bacterium (Candidatus Blackallbacteria) CG17_big_fil_post_rev_8_21_14_2_50_48_46 TaxID=2014261 RepID=A0A2M7G080_9BACT|nr:MAG: hypothetical protein COW64_25090 [bacterium (Candidatus Blackallbacteria) CG18_big_fil_WC_8_21_14_2_50_49_26]PIW15086.1 MAG: hypothetical protein COW36_19380 [bacterium (Candidatus Blackallbacteria) CG17_big_fil_post_rev_8_21_14_2_50_48_46]PIW47591.1 MAG: hypothetical protein COW20_11940 [bacterium (Candidatus Blackallbacteria) CG13_big_fil_rev_8_21_14_2_50_49_14]